MFLPDLPSLLFYDHLRQFIGMQDTAFLSHTPERDRMVLLRQETGPDLVCQLPADDTYGRPADRIGQLISCIDECLYRYTPLQIRNKYGYNPLALCPPASKSVNDLRQDTVCQIT